MINALAMLIVDMTCCQYIVYSYITIAMHDPLITKFSGHLSVTWHVAG